MAKKVVTLKGENGDVLYPRALATELYDESGNKVSVLTEIDVDALTDNEIEGLMPD